MRTLVADPAAIRTMFDRLAPRYDLFNKLSTFGLDGSWRKKVLEPVKDGMRILDIGCGTGELVFEAARKMRGGRVTGIDSSEAMLAVARKKLARFPKKGPEIHFIHKSAEELPFEKERYDLVVSAFVLRNLPNLRRILSGALETLRDNGVVRFMDLTEPDKSLSAWRFYMKTYVNFCGKAVFGRDYPSEYLAESARVFLSPSQMTGELMAAGFTSVSITRWACGAIVLYQAAKP